MAIFGPAGTTSRATGRFFNSLHFWGVQLFFAFMVLHLAVKYFLGAFRDGRWKTWMIGVLTLGAAIFSGFTGYLSAANWSAQWHAVEAKDAMNAMGVGGFFFTTNYSQVLTLHVAVFPADRGPPRRGPHPFHQARKPREALPREGRAKEMSRSSDEYLRGVPMKPYDLVREGLIALGIVAVLVIVLAIIFKSPDAPTVSGEDVAKNHPLDYLKTATDFLSGESGLQDLRPSLHERHGQHPADPGPRSRRGARSDPAPGCPEGSHHCPAGEGCGAQQGRRRRPRRVEGRLGGQAEGVDQGIQRRAGQGRGVERPSEGRRAATTAPCPS